MGSVLSLYVIHHLASESEKQLQKVITLENYQQAVMSGLVMLESADIDDTRNCIHCAMSDQTPNVINKFFPGGNVVILNLNLNKLEKNGFELRMEANRLSGNLYPHLYHTSGKRKVIPFECIDTVIES